MIKQIKETLQIRKTVLQIRELHETIKLNKIQMTMAQDQLVIGHGFLESQDTIDLSRNNPNYSENLTLALLFSKLDYLKLSIKLNEKEIEDLTKTLFENN